MSEGPPAPRRWPLPTDPVSVVSLLCFVGYFLISRVVLSLFPFCTYSMFSNINGAHGDGLARGCHLLAVGPDGRASDVTEFRSWDCPPWEDAARRSVDELSCPLYFNVEDPIREYIRRNAVHPLSRSAAGRVPPNILDHPIREYIQRDAGHGPVRVDLVRRVWVFANGQAPTRSDHLIASCQAVLR
jgi:hypothetical protein